MIIKSTLKRAKKQKKFQTISERPNERAVGKVIIIETNRKGEKLWRPIKDKARVKITTRVISQTTARKLPKPAKKAGKIPTAAALPRTSVNRKNLSSEGRFYATFACFYIARITIDAFVPPNPKELESAIFIFFSFAFFGTRSMPAQAAEIFSRFKVGGRIPVSSAFRE
jgi:hypothetical protein